MTIGAANLILTSLRPTTVVVAIVLLMIAAGRQAFAEAIAVDAEYPGGNVIVEKIDGDSIVVRPDLRDTQEGGWWFYWNFRIRNAAGKKVTVSFSGQSPIGARGPAVSFDRGETWTWLDADKVRNGSFVLEVPSDADEARLAFSIPYQEANLKEFLARHSKSPNLRVEEHCRTKKGRVVERLHVGRIDGKAEHRVLLTARHHACEMIASYALEGLIEAALADPWICQNVEICAIPFMDKDGVEDGDQGKNRSPHDHNRDYADASIYPSVATLRKFAPEWSRGKLRFAMDMHCPYISGGGDQPGSNERIYFVYGTTEKVWPGLAQFSSILRQAQEGPLPFDPKHNLPFGQSWNKGTDKSRTFASWASELDGVEMAATIEIPYANVGDRLVTTDAARSLGRDLAVTLAKFLRRDTPLDAGARPTTK